MPKSHRARATNEEYMRMIVAVLEEKGQPMSLTALRDTLNCCHRNIRIFMSRLESDGLVESFEMRDRAHRVREHFCITGKRPDIVRSGPKIINPADTLSAFREAVSGAMASGNDPFRVAA